MKYFQLARDWYNKGNIVSCFPKDLRGMPQNAPTLGKRIDDWVDGVTFVYDPKRNESLADRLSSPIDWCIVSSKMKAVIEENGVRDVQFLPVLLENRETGEVLEGYSLFNVLTVLAAVDREHSEIDEFDDPKLGQRWSVRAFAFKQEALDDHDVFYVNQWDADFYTEVFVTDKIRKAIKNNGITGCQFLEVKVY